jgi:hypothetical protein
MEEIIRFIRNFIAKEHEVMIQIRTELDIPLVEANLNSLNQFFQGLDSDLYLSSSRTLEELDKVLELFQPRTLFQIKQYIHPVLGSIYRVYLSSPFRGDHRYFSNFYIANTVQGLKIIAHYNLCNYCSGIGNRAGIVCDECHGFGWNWRGGQKLEELGELVAELDFAVLVKS